MKNVIYLTHRLEKQSKAKRKAQVAPAPVIDMTEKRQEMIAQERRQVKRTILSEFVGAFALVPRKGLLKVNLYDISENGLAFDVEAEAGHFSIGEEIAMRVYLNQQTYFPFVVRVQNVRSIEEEDAFRHGANFLKGTINDEALHHFVKFIETVSASLQSDAGDITVTNIAR
jgi:hypothetical protein